MWKGWYIEQLSNQYSVGIYFTHYKILEEVPTSVLYAISNEGGYY